MTRRKNTEDFPTKSLAEKPCALCRHCRTFLRESEGGPRYVKLRCARGHWQTPTGRERTHHFYRVRDIKMPDCPDFDAMVDPDENPKQVLRDLRDHLPDERMVCGERG